MKLADLKDNILMSLNAGLDDSKYRKAIELVCNQPPHIMTCEVTKRRFTKTADVQTALMNVRLDGE